MRTCTECNEKKELALFYKHRQSKGGYFTKCKECTKKKPKYIEEIIMNYIRL